MKRCTTCGERKPLRAFYPRGDTRHGSRYSNCKSCEKARQRQLRVTSRRWIREYAARWRDKNRRLVKSANAFINEDGEGKVQLTNYYRLRHDAILAYGGYRCACCGAGEALFLTIDHINNGGTRHRRRVGFSSGFFRWLKDNDYPKGFQVLCSNCNHGRYRNGGVCPHKDPVGKRRQ